MLASRADARSRRRLAEPGLLGGALSGRDITAVQKTVAGLLKLISPNPAVEVADDDLEWAVRLALESRRVDARDALLKG